MEEGGWEDEGKGGREVGGVRGEGCGEGRKGGGGS